MYAMSLLLAAWYVWTVAESVINIIPNNFNCIAQKHHFISWDKFAKIILADVIAKGIVVTSDVYSTSHELCAQFALVCDLFCFFTIWFYLYPLG